MMEKVLIASLDEIWLKSERTRSYFLYILLNHIRRHFPNVYVINDGGKLIVKNIEKEKLANFFGISKVVEGIRVSKNNIYEGIKFMVDKVKDRIIKITVNRADKRFPKKSIEFAKEIAKYLENNGIKTSIKKYDLELIIDIRFFGVYIYFNDFIEGVRGLPYGVEGKTISSFSGGFDSTIASWLIAKRGVRIKYFVNFLPDNKIRKEIVDIFEKLNEKWYLESKLLIVYGKDIIEEIKKVKDGYRQIIYKRVLYKIMEKIALENNLYSFVTGDSIGQKSSQTLINLYYSSKDLNVLVLRPLLSNDKVDTINLSKRLGLYDLIIKVKEYCKISEKPFTNPRYDIIIEEEKKLNIDLDNLKIEDVEI